MLQGRIQRGAHQARSPPKIGKNKICLRKIVIFTRNTPKFFAPPSARRNFFKCAPPSLKSWMRPCVGGDGCQNKRRNLILVILSVIKSCSTFQNGFHSEYVDFPFKVNADTSKDILFIKLNRLLTNLIEFISSSTVTFVCGYLRVLCFPHFRMASIRNRYISLSKQAS